MKKPSDGATRAAEMILDLQGWKPPHDGLKKRMAEIIDAETAPSLARLAGLLRKYGDHLGRCALQRGHKDCDCGFHAALAEIPGEEKR